MKPPVPRFAGTRLYCGLPLSPGAEIALSEAAARHTETAPVAVLQVMQGRSLTGAVAALGSITCGVYFSFRLRRSLHALPAQAEFLHQRIDRRDHDQRQDGG